MGKMVTVYLRDEVELELLKHAQRENEERMAQHKKPIITKSKIVARIVEAWYEGREIRQSISEKEVKP